MTIKRKPKEPRTDNAASVALEISCDNSIAYYALRLAEVLDKRSALGGIFSKGPTSKLEPAWDGYVRRQSWGRFWEGANQNTHYIFFQQPSESQLLVARHHGAKSIVVTGLHQVAPSNVRNLAFADRVVCSSWSAANVLSSVYNVSNARYLPLDLPLVHTKKTRLVNRGRVSVALPCAGWPIRSVMNDALYLAEELVAQYSNLNLRFVMFRSMPKACRSRLRALQTAYGDRVSVMKPESISAASLEFMKSDLTLWPARFDSTGVPVLASLYSGTPVVAYNTTPMHELIANGRNSVLVECNLTSDYNGMPIVGKDPNNIERFKVTAFRLLDRKNSLRRLRAESHYDLTNRKILFENGWCGILGL